MTTDDTKIDPLAGLSSDKFMELARRHLKPAHDIDIFHPASRPARGDHDLNADNDLSELHVSPRPASVLVPIVPRSQGLQALLTLRSAHLPTHAGQIAFPGGKVEPDDESPLHTALR